LGYETGKPRADVATGVRISEMPEDLEEQISQLVVERLIVFRGPNEDVELTWAKTRTFACSMVLQRQFVPDQR